jgi:hypothetical protein
VWLVHQQDGDMGECENRPRDREIFVWVLVRIYNDAAVKLHTALLLTTPDVPFDHHLHRSGINGLRQTFNTASV